MELTARECREILDAAHNAIVAINREGRIIVFNKAAADIVDFPQEEALGLRADEVIPNTKLLDVLETGIGAQGQRMAVGGRIILSNRSPILRDQEIVGAVGVFQDISELEAISHKLDTMNAMNRELDAIIESVADGIVVADDQGYIIRANQAYLCMTGVSKDEFVGKHVQELYQQGYANRIVSQMVIERRSRVNTVDIRNGKELLMTGTPVFENGQLVRVVTAVRDVTDLNELKGKLAESKEMLERYYYELEHLRSLQSFQKIITQSTEMQKKVEMAFYVARVDSTVLILGESGVGKELIAQLIHRASKRSKQPFIKINCGAIPDTLLESELFGYEPGAFSGAQKEGKLGLFELAQGGTLFLDEVGELPLNLQVKVLRALQDKEITRIGGKKTIKLDVRFVAATNRNIEEMVREKTLREDLYYRLNVVPIQLPPLRERKEDILPLVTEFLQKFNNRYGYEKWIHPEAAKILYEYDWPGNIRQLENTIERLVVTTRGDCITPENLENISKSVLCTDRKECGPLQTHLENEEKHLIAVAYNQTRSTRKAAALLQISQASMVKKMQKYGIKVEKQIPGQSCVH